MTDLEICLRICIANKIKLYLIMLISIKKNTYKLYFGRCLSALKGLSKMPLYVAVPKLEKSVLPILNKEF